MTTRNETARKFDCLGREVDSDCLRSALQRSCCQHAGATANIQHPGAVCYPCRIKHRLHRLACHCAKGPIVTTNVGLPALQLKCGELLRIMRLLYWQGHNSKEVQLPHERDHRGRAKLVAVVWCSLMGTELQFKPIAAEVLIPRSVGVGSNHRLMRNRVPTDFRFRFDSY